MSQLAQEYPTFDRGSSAGVVHWISSRSSPGHYRYWLTHTLPTLAEGVIESALSRAEYTSPCDEVKLSQVRMQRGSALVMFELFTFIESSHAPLKHPCLCDVHDKSEASSPKPSMHPLSRGEASQVLDQLRR